MSTVSTLAEGSASALESGSPVPSSSTARTLPPRSRTINVIIPSAQATTRLVTPLRHITGTHGHGDVVVSSDEVLSAGGTFTHGHGDFVVSSPHDSPATPTQLRMSARTRRRSSMFSASNMQDEEAGVGASPRSTGAGAGGLTMSPMEESEEHAPEARAGDEDEEEGGHAVSQES